MYGVQKSGKSYFKEDLFFIDPDKFFLFNDGKQWHAHGKYCFVKPVENKEEFFLFTGVKEEPLVGTIKYINQELIDKGLKVGDQIGFQPDSEYEFTVEDEKLYRMFTNNITMLLWYIL